MDENECIRCHNMMSIDAGCEPTDYCHPCAQEVAAEVDSLRQQLAVQSAALAQHARALDDAALYLRSAQRLVDYGAVNGTPWFAGLVDFIASLPVLRASPDVAHAVRVEAARDAVIQAARVHNERCTASGMSWVTVEHAIKALDGLTSERRRDGGGA